MCPDSHKAKCEECLKFRELCPYCNNIRKLNKLCEVISLYGIDGIPQNPSLPELVIKNICETQFDTNRCRY